MLAVPPAALPPTNKPNLSQPASPDFLARANPLISRSGDRQQLRFWTLETAVILRYGRPL